MRDAPVDGDGERSGGSDDSDDSDAIDTDRDPAEIVDDIDRPVLLFDGVCNLCHGTIRAIVKLDAEGKILFAPLQSDVGTELLSRIGLDADYFDSVVLIEAGEAYTKSTAVLRTCRYLDGPVPLLYPLVYVPESVRDLAYDLVAKYRYRIFGKKDECTVPDPEIRRRFVERSLV